MIDDDHGSNDAELRKLFSSLRKEEALLTPRFKAGSSVRRNTVHWPFGMKLAGACVCAVAILAAVLYLRHEPLRHGPTQQTGAPVASITDWKPPTSFLLNTPGNELLRASPSLELRPYLGAMPSLKQHAPRVRKRPLP